MQNDEATQKNLMRAVELATESILSGVSLAQQGAISNKKVEALYALGFNYYAQKNFPKAEEIFAFALSLDFYHTGIVNGLAASRKMQGKYEEALKIYALAALLELDNPEPSFYAAECFFSLDKMTECGQALEAAAGLAEDEEEHCALLEKIQKMQTTLKEQAHA